MDVGDIVTQMLEFPEPDLQDRSELRLVQINPESLLADIGSIEDQNRDVETIDFTISSLDFADRDFQVLRASKRLYNGLLELLPDEVHEYGCGAGLHLFKRLKPGLQNRMRMFELHDGAIEYANRTLKREGHKQRVEKGNIHRINQRDVSAIVGVNSYDSTNFLEQAISSTYEALAPGGVFIHIQNVCPDFSTVVISEARRRQGKLSCYIMPNLDAPPLTHILTVEGWMDSISHLQQRIAKICSDIGFETNVVNASAYYLGYRLPHQEFNVYMHRGNEHVSGDCKDIKNGSVLEIARYSTVIAKKN